MLVVEDDVLALASDGKGLGVGDKALCIPLDKSLLSYVPGFIGL